MYTTLATLKQTEACVGGYTRMISFLTTKPKDTPLPLWMVGMIGQWDDMEWARDNALFIDKDMFDQFRKVTLLSVFKHMYWHTRRGSHTRSKNPYVTDFMKAAENTVSFEGASLLLEEGRTRHFSNDMWISFVENQVWYQPHEYIKYVMDSMDGTATHFHRTTRRGVKNDHYYFPYNPKLPKALNFALMCTNGRDPYTAMVEIMMSLNLGKKKGFQMSSMVEGETTKYAATLHVSDPKKIFLLYHVLNGSNVNIAEVSGVNSVAATISDTFGDSISEVLDANSETIKRLIDKSPSMDLLPPAASIESWEPLALQETEPDESEDE